MFRTCLLTWMLAGLLLVVVPAAVAQDAGNNDQHPPAAGPPEGGRMRARMDPARRVEVLTKELKLTSDQQAKALDILNSQRSQMENLHQDSSLSIEDRRKKMMDIHKASSDKIRALLDADQQKKFDDIEARHQQWMQGHHPAEGMDAPEHAPEQK